MKFFAVLLATASAACTPAADDAFTDAGGYTCSGWAGYTTLEDFCVYGKADYYGTAYSVKQFSELVCKCGTNSCELEACKTLTDSSDKATSAKVKGAAVCATVKDCPADATTLADGETACYDADWKDVVADAGTGGTGSGSTTPAGDSTGTVSSASPAGLIAVAASMLVVLH